MTALAFLAGAFAIAGIGLCILWGVLEWFESQDEEREE